MTRTRGKLVIALLASVMISGCYARAGLYPVSSSLTPTPTAPIYIKMTGAFTSGSVSLTLADGEVCKGKWKESTATSSNPMIPVWDSIYGNGYYVAHVLGTRLYAEAVLSGQRGTALTIQMYRRESGDKDEITPIRGVAKDNHGTAYKVAS